MKADEFLNLKYVVETTEKIFKSPDNEKEKEMLEILLGLYYRRIMLLKTNKVKKTIPSSIKYGILG